MRDQKTFLKSLPNLPGVYQMLSKDREVLYVGKAINLKKRVTSYFSGKKLDIKTAALLKHVVDIDITVTRSEMEALLLESNLIKKLKPHYNILFRDDKSYPFIVITEGHDFPRIDLFRGSKNSKDLYFGPYPNGSATRETINLIEKLFRLRTCSNTFFASRTRPCLQYQIGRCTAPCTAYISKEDYAKNVKLAILFLQGKNEEILTFLKAQMENAAHAKNYEQAAEYRDQMLKLRSIQEKQYVTTEHGDADVIGLFCQANIACIQLLSVREGRVLGSRSYFPSLPMSFSPEEIISSFMMQHYLGEIPREIPREIILSHALKDEKVLTEVLSNTAKRKVVLTAAVRSERKKWLETAKLSAQHAVANQMMRKANLEERFSALKTALGLAETPNRLECFDISHTMGEETVASCVVFDKNGPLKNDYRRFNISGITPGDDIAAMKQVLTRRFKRVELEPAKVPDVVFIDGGKAQLHAAQIIFENYGIQGVALVGVAKGVTRKPGFETLVFPHEKPPMHLPPDSHALHLIQQIRDEAHRFAIVGHRNRRDKKRQTSTLESIPGIGAKRRRELLRYFGGIQAINHASLEEIAKVPGISRALAERIYQILHTT